MKIEQRCGRADRIGQQRDVHIHFFQNNREFFFKDLTNSVFNCVPDDEVVDMEVRNPA